MNELIVVTSARGVGKSRLAATYLPPSELDSVYVHDSEKSMNQIRKRLVQGGLDFGRYVDLEGRFSDLPGGDDLLDRINAGKLPWTTDAERAGMLGYYKFIMDDLAKNLTPGKYKLYIHDTLEKLESGMVAWVDENRKAAGAKGGARSSPFGQFWWGAYYPLYQQFLAAVWARGVETIIFCSHLKNPWSGNRPVPGKVQPSGKNILYQLSSLFLWLVHEPANADGAPAGLILKERMGDLHPDENSLDGWGGHRMLPRRIPHCTWADVKRYLRDGCDLANPAPGEVMSDMEREMTSELLSTAQMKLMQLEAEKEVLKLQAQVPDLLQQEQPKLEIPSIAGEVKEVKPETNTTAMALLAEGKSPMDVARELGLPLRLVLEAKKAMEVT